MKTFRIITILSIFYYIPAHASYLEVCQISGEVTSSPRLNGKDVSFKLHVVSSVATNCKAIESYNPEICNNYIGRKYEISLSQSWVSTVKVGEKLTLIQQKYDDVNGNRYVSIKLPEDCE